MLAIGMLIILISLTLESILEFQLRTPRLLAARVMFQRDAALTAPGPTSGAAQERHRPLQASSPLPKTVRHWRSWTCQTLHIRGWLLSLLLG